MLLARSPVDPLDAVQTPRSTLTIERVDDTSAAAWNSFVEGAANASAYHRYEWRRVITDVFGHETCYFAARDSRGEIHGVLPTVRLRSRLFGDFFVSMPYFNYGGVLAARDDAADALIDAAAGRAEELGAGHLELRHRANVKPAWPVRTDKVAMYLRLPGNPDALGKQLGSKLRSQIKRPQKEGAVGTNGGRELLDEFYAVFSRNMRDLGTPVYPRRWFAAILDAFPDRTRVFVVRHGGKPVAAAMLVGDRKHLEIPWASSLRESNSIGVNMLLYWNVLEYACAQGYQVFDFGRSTLDSGTFKFKSQWGAQPQQLYWHYWMKDGGEPPVINPSNPKYRLAVAAWQRLPLAVANRLGPLLVRNLP